MNREDRVLIGHLFEEIKGHHKWHIKKDEKTQEHRVDITNRLTAVETELKNFKDLKKTVYDTSSKVDDYDDVKKRVSKNSNGIQNIKTVWTTVFIAITLLAAATSIYANFDKIFK